jgi:hypothetical protein
MQATISVSGRGLIALPAELRKAAGIRPQDSIIAETTPEGILCAEPPLWDLPAPAGIQRNSKLPPSFPCLTGRDKRNEIFFQDAPFFSLTTASLLLW